MTKQEYKKKGFKNQEQYNDYLDTNNLIICDGCENETKEYDINDVYNKALKVFDHLCPICFSFEDRD